MAGDRERPPEPGEAGSPHPRPNWTAARVTGLVFTAIGGLIGLALLIGGIAVLAAYAFGRDDDGYFTSDRKELRSSGYAITSGDIDLGADEFDWAPDDVLGKVRLQVASGNGKSIFVGIGSDEDVHRYLAGVAHGELVDFDGRRPELEPHAGGRPRAPPGGRRFWVAKAEGTGEQAVAWDAEFGRWTAVVMNADGTRAVDVEADAGIRLGWVAWAGLGMLVIGLLMTAGAVIVVLLIGRRASADRTTA